MVGCVETAKSIEIPFGYGLRNHVLGGGPDFPRERAIFVRNVSTLH